MQVDITLKKCLMLIKLNLEMSILGILWLIGFLLTVDSFLLNRLTFYQIVIPTFLL